MRPGEQFEKKCCEYLNEEYGNEELKFIRNKTTDSTTSDIKVVKNGRELFYIEVKDACSQGGQFVCEPDETNKEFIFSKKNKSRRNTITNTIIHKMNDNFDLFKNPGTKGVIIPVESRICADWIKTHYANLNVKYVISRYRNELIIAPLDKLDIYFDVSATYREKKSGSRVPSKKDIENIKNELENSSVSCEFIFPQNNQKQVIIRSSANAIPPELNNIDDSLYFSKFDDDSFYVRKCSNTRHANVIFSLKSIRGQNIKDLRRFENDLESL